LKPLPYTVCSIIDGLFDLSKEMMIKKDEKFHPYPADLTCWSTTSLANGLLGITFQYEPNDNKLPWITHMILQVMSQAKAVLVYEMDGFNQAKLLKQFAHDQAWNKLKPQAIKEAATVLGFSQTKKEVTSKHNQICTFSQTGKTFVDQLWWRCQTCWPNREEIGCCEVCAKVCHQGHIVRANNIASPFYCDCGAGTGPNPCKCLSEKKAEITFDPELTKIKNEIFLKGSISLREKGLFEWLEHLKKVSAGAPVKIPTYTQTLNPAGNKLLVDLFENKFVMSSYRANLLFQPNVGTFRHLQVSHDKLNWETIDPYKTFPDGAILDKPVPVNTTESYRYIQLETLGFLETFELYGDFEVDPVALEDVPVSCLHEFLEKTPKPLAIVFPNDAQSFDFAFPEATQSTHIHIAILPLDHKQIRLQNVSLVGVPTTTEAPKKTTGTDTGNENTDPTSPGLAIEPVKTEEKPKTTTATDDLWAMNEALMAALDEEGSQAQTEVTDFFGTADEKPKPTDDKPKPDEADKKVDEKPKTDDTKPTDANESGASDADPANKPTATPDAADEKTNNTTTDEKNTTPDASGAKPDTPDDKKKDPIPDDKTLVQRPQKRANQQGKEKEVKKPLPSLFVYPIRQTDVTEIFRFPLDECGILYEIGCTVNKQYHQWQCPNGLLTCPNYMLLYYGQKGYERSILNISTQMNDPESKDRYFYADLNFRQHHLCPTHIKIRGNFNDHFFRFTIKARSTKLEADWVEIARRDITPEQKFWSKYEETIDIDCPRFMNDFRLCYWVKPTLLNSYFPVGNIEFFGGAIFPSNHQLTGIRPPK